MQIYKDEKKRLMVVMVISYRFWSKQQESQQTETEHPLKDP